MTAKPTTEIEITQQALTLADEARAMRIRTLDDYDQAGAFLRRCKGMRDQISAFMAPVKRAAHEAHRAAIAQEKQALAPVEEAERLVKREVVRYQQELEAERRRQEEAVRAMERERAEAAALEAARLCELNGDHEQAEEILDNVEMFEEPVNLEAMEVRTEGVSIRQTWRYRVVDEALVPREYLMLDEKKIGAVVRAMKALTRIPGIEAYPDETVAVRA